MSGNYEPIYSKSNFILLSSNDAHDSAILSFCYKTPLKIIFHCWSHLVSTQYNNIFTKKPQKTKVQQFNKYLAKVKKDNWVIDAFSCLIRVRFNSLQALKNIAKSV